MKQNILGCFILRLFEQMNMHYFTSTSVFSMGTVISGYRNRFAKKKNYQAVFEMCSQQFILQLPGSLATQQKKKPSCSLSRLGLLLNGYFLREDEKLELTGRITLASSVDYGSKTFGDPGNIWRIEFKEEICSISCDLNSWAMRGRIRPTVLTWL